ncbi:MAG: stage V sporulation protein AB [Eubacterium sp.]
MTLINGFFLAFIGLASGLVVAAGIFAFISMLGIVPRLAQRTGTAPHIYGYEWMIIIGGTLGNIINLFVKHLPVTTVGLVIFGLFSGIFVGCLAMALAENLRVIPIFVRRMRLKKGLPIILLAMAVGKCIGSIVLFFFQGT